MSAPDRDLLFGMLALQNGLVDQGQLVAAFLRRKVRVPGADPNGPESLGIRMTAASALPGDAP